MAGFVRQPQTCRAAGVGLTLWGAVQATCSMARQDTPDLPVAVPRPAAEALEVQQREDHQSAAGSWQYPAGRRQSAATTRQAIEGNVMQCPDRRQVLAMCWHAQRRQ